jgi:pimeloyl-ACP methyl ester carboxylesterase
VSELEIQVPGGSLVAWPAGEGRPTLILHGGPVSDTTAELLPCLPAGLRTIRYQQRGIEPSTTEGPFDVETHVADAVRVLDAFDIERALVIGHSWGGHLAFHLAVAHPERVVGLIGIDPLGAVGNGGWPDLDEGIFQRLRAADPDAAERAQELDERAMAGNATAEELDESVAAAWPYYFAYPSSAPPAPADLRVSVPLYAGVVESVHEHFDRRTLERGLAGFGRPVLIVHGVDDPLPWGASRATVDVLPNAELVLIERCGHHPWLEQPDELRAALVRYVDALDD